ncbi:uncharacterized protein LOC116339091 [Contarinia nasturtii]|uniref:uncharacterized protein LOC116339091 n=1 Tax=Contarinia nasturtii TaxID=265458 RepID=UPI0012D414BB|nr:uncharacterized protein LOC116339091 [Contarinia nasturtii]
MFSGLDNFLNGNNNLNLNDMPDTSLQSSVNDSFDLDMSDLVAEKKSQKNGKNPKMGGDDDDSDSDSNGVSFVPVKGQKLAARRLKKIGDTLNSKMVQTKRVQVQKERLASKKKSPKKRTTRGRRQRRIVDSDLSDLDSEDSDEPATSNGPTRRPYNPNLIVLDCDDEFIGGPAVNVTRNLATASVVSVEESMDLKVSVRINGKIEHFFMNKFQKFSVLIGQICDKKKVPSDHVRLMFKENTVYESDTPQAINYVQGLVLQAHITDMASKSKTTAKSLANANAGKMEIKIQSAGRKRPFITYIGSTDQLITLAFACAEEFKCDVNKVLIEFDGEFINFKETADDLGLEGGEVFDFYEKKK